MRGKVNNWDICFITCRITPAYAGKRDFNPERGGDAGDNVINLKRPLNGKQNVWKYQNGEEKSDSDGREKDV